MLPLWLGGRLLIALGEEAPVREAFSVRTALDGARRARAREFAAADLSAAEQAADRALSEFYRTVAEKTGVFRYDHVRHNLVEAQGKAVQAWRRARQRSTAARLYASGVIIDGRAGLAAAESAMQTAPIGSAVRANLARARVAIRSADARWRAGDYDAAVREATFARDTAAEIRRRASTFFQTYTTGAAADKWARWVKETIDLSRRRGDYVVLVDKLQHKCHLYRGGRLVRTYAADLGGPLRDKMHAGDRATPEGMYRIIRKRTTGQTTYYKALLINYPNEEDRAQFAVAKRNGSISRRAAIGGLIEIHGEGGRREDWTLGCVALSNRDMDELFRLVDVGTPVTIVGTIASNSGPISG